MTVKELINWLNDFDDDTEIIIGMFQRYGSNFSIEIESVSLENVDFWDNEEDDVECVVITEGRQIGSVNYELNCEDDNY